MALLEVTGVSKSFRGLKAVSNASFAIPEGSIIAGVFSPDSGSILFNNLPIHGLRPDQICAAGIGRTFQIVKPFAGLSVLDNVIVGALHKEKRVSSAREFSLS